MVCPDEKVAAAHITQRIKGRNRQCGEQILRSEGFNVLGLEKASEVNSSGVLFSSKSGLVLP
ncbi:hypothetical protein JCM17380_26110 [Desulfosporosinus burensis]